MKRLLAIYGAAALAASPAIAGREQFIDYYASASSLIATLNSIAADVERLNVKSGVFSDEEAGDMQARLVKAREGFSQLIANDDHTYELNEGYILYVDKMMLAIMLAREYQNTHDVDKLARVGVLAAEAAELRAKLNQTIQKDKKTYDLQ